MITKSGPRSKLPEPKEAREVGETWALEEKEEKGTGFSFVLLPFPSSSSTSALISGRREEAFQRAWTFVEPWEVPLSLGFDFKSERNGRGLDLDLDLDLNSSGFLAFRLSFFAKGKGGKERAEFHPFLSGLRVKEMN